MVLKNYYQILNLKTDCQLLDIKKSYRSLALKYHPDKNKSSDAQEKFIEITEAYEVLRDPLKRKQYDLIFKVYYTQANNSNKKEDQNSFSTDAQKTWSEYGYRRAKEYADIPFDDFARKLLKEVSTGVGYIPNIIALITTLGIGFALLSSIHEIFDKGIFGGFFVLVFIGGIFFISFKLVQVAKADYIQDRKRNNL